MEIVHHLLYYTDLDKDSSDNWNSFKSLLQTYMTDNGTMKR